MQIVQEEIREQGFVPVFFVPECGYDDMLKQKPQKSLVDCSVAISLCDSSHC